MNKCRLINFFCICVLVGSPVITFAEEIKNIEGSSQLLDSFAESTENSVLVEKETVETIDQPTEISSEESHEKIEDTTEGNMEILEGIESEELDTEEYIGDRITEENQHALGNTAREISTSARSYSSRDISSNQQNLPRIDFVDVSSYQGNISVADYLNMKSQGITGVVVKLTEGTSYINPNAENQIRNAQAAGLKVSAYHYSWFVNKSTAESEARYFANTAKRLGLNNETVMVNDAEQGETNNGKLTENSGYFATILKNEFGFSKIIHYSMASWFKPGIIDMSKLGGNQNAWKAEFPYTPSKDRLLHTDSSAWQWSSDTHFVGDSNKSRLFDTNIDYSGTFSSPRSYEYIPIDQKMFIINSNGAIYNEPYTPNAWRQDITSGMQNQLIDVTAQSQTSYGLWYEFSYVKNGINKVGWIKSVDVGEVIEQKKDNKTLYVKIEYGSVFDSPYVPTSKRIDTTSDFKDKRFNKTEEARTPYGTWYYGTYEKNGSVITGWIKSVDLDTTVPETPIIEKYENKGFINRNSGSIYESPHVDGVKKQDTIDGLYGQTVDIQAKSQTKSGIWYQTKYVKKGVVNTGWIKSVDIDFIRNEKDTKQNLVVNKSYGSVYDSPYTPSSKKIDTTNDFKGNKFIQTKEAETGYGTWYYGTYEKNGSVKTGWIKSVDLDSNDSSTEKYENKGFINKGYGSIYSAPYIDGVPKLGSIDSTMNGQVIFISEKSLTNYGIWYKCTYSKSGLTTVGWIKSDDIDFVINEKNDNKLLQLNKSYGSVYDRPYTTDSKKIDITADVRGNLFNKNKEAETAYGIWYYGTYEKNGVMKSGWVKSVDFN